MLVEDDDGFRGSLALLLKSAFPTILLEEAADGSEAIDKLKSLVPQLIFMDIKLPGQNGLEITKRIKALYPEIDVIILTSYDYPEYREAARASGASRFFSKGSLTSRQIEDVVEEMRAKCKASQMSSG
jgi:DNA-binding NarL/FixJ family response regulator